MQLIVAFLASPRPMSEQPWVAREPRYPEGLGAATAADCHDIRGMGFIISADVGREAACVAMAPQPPN